MNLQNSETKQSILLDLAKQRLLPLCLSISLAAIATLLGLVPFVIIYLMAIELLNPPIDQNYIWILAAVSVAAIFFKYLCKSLAISISHRAANAIICDVRLAIAQKLNRVPLGYFNQNSIGQIKKIMADDAENLEEALGHILPDFVSVTTLVLLTTIYLFTVDWRMTLATLAVFPIALAGQAWSVQAAVKPLYKPFHDSLEDMNSTIVEYVRGMKVVKAFGQTATSYEKYENAVNRYHKIYQEWVWKSLPGLSVFFVGITANIVTILPVGTWLYLSGSIDMSTLILFLVLGLSFNAPLSKLMSILSDGYYMFEGMKRIEVIFNEQVLSVSECDRQPTNSSIEFRNVTFSYNEKQVLRDISFTAKQGTVTAFVGPSGAGKTTVARLIPRFWDASSGEILIGGVSVRDMSFETLMSQIAFVFQDVFLFQDTVLENIRLGNPNASDAEVIAAAKMARVHEFVEALPQGYQTVAGARGAKLSGGQKQRIAIARAILKNALIVILDEATAFLDPENEAKIQEAIGSLIQNKTLIVIAHRLSTITESDQIIVLNKGTIVDRGRHSELLQTSELYGKMWQAHNSVQDLEGSIPVLQKPQIAKRSLR
ncbi:MAG: ABC transporter ATP-binding protein [Microcoleus sp. PH2017_10_PVI_O_A]|uniref:ABC transporter ATP-binding protein n=1 Tax=unclassified Microcoleus TaxID=2642155 RepID=UPI001D244111|nr:MULTISPECIES: ABC transporter ATP-binding protein [unclassified Microcoleus]MCC3409716.1 ABC transporter ATP-binding protein [Microcoleus sp. PH2017_10_PVI_O_A]MCC3463982.1 ABC transporter ATP-binding protein [Microcoleus sp. PH2017_11_PCY_U_A]MCC3482312.1 ABC transporter ATP-binding protein [Microcoleus sp. PH2017_12_PCY_D_A]MCC3529938.1 ABC transporter ATP-binding protein [Microcoleus sp. PH2017_21_RUC_O_A]MCC3542232.1 ABC transporter ATP-binding protein [Microcoleus sp. PH2017_22_RUC_O_B